MMRYKLKALWVTVCTALPKREWFSSSFPMRLKCVRRT